MAAAVTAGGLPPPVNGDSGGIVLAIIAAILFGIARIFQLAGATLGTHIGFDTFLAAGLLCLALHLAGIGATTNWRRSGWRRH
jgi:hypothetical protein